jgi:selenocysteine lyase/cysteine desulfurase
LRPDTAIAKLCRDRGIWFHIDGAQSAGMFPFSLRELGCDSFATSGHKWIGGPLETGLLFIRRERLDDVAAVMVGAYSGDLEYLPGTLRLNGTAMRYEYGTRNSAAILGLAEAMRLQERIGRDQIAARGRTLAARVRTGLLAIPSVEVLTPTAPEMSASMVTFRSSKLKYDELFGRLFKDHALRCRPVSEQRLDAVRVSTHLFNSPAQCDALIAATAKILQAT